MARGFCLNNVVGFCCGQGKWSDLVGHRLALMLSLALSGSGYIVLGMSTSILFLALARVPIGLFHFHLLCMYYPCELLASLYKVKMLIKGVRVVVH